MEQNQRESRGAQLLREVKELYNSLSRRDKDEVKAALNILHKWQEVA